MVQTPRFLLPIHSFVLPAIPNGYSAVGGLHSCWAETHWITPSRSSRLMGAAFCHLSKIYGGYRPWIFFRMGQRPGLGPSAISISWILPQHWRQALCHRPWLSRHL